MTREEFDRHLKLYCECCRHFRNGRCPAVVQLGRNTNDESTNRMFQRLGRCSQYEHKA